MRFDRRPNCARGDTESNSRDVFPNQTPDWTALSEDRVLTQALRYLEDARVKVIGIIGTDPRDTIFLARLIRRYCPDARIFTVGTDLLYLDPASIADLRGMIIGSTYPLYASNHSWTNSDPASRGLVFPSESAQGVYNAASVQIARLTGQLGAEKDRGGGKLLEYSTPTPLTGRFALDAEMPPVWVSVVGERSLYPVDCQPFAALTPSIDPDYLYSGRFSSSKPSKLLINRCMAWVVFLAVASLVLVTTLSRRLIHAWETPRPNSRRPQARAGRGVRPHFGQGLARGRLPFHRLSGAGPAHPGHRSIESRHVLVAMDPYGDRGPAARCNPGCAGRAGRGISSRRFVLAPRGSSR